MLSEMCSASTPIIMLSDVFDMLVLADCEVMFNFVEDGVSTWKAVSFQHVKLVKKKGSPKNFLSN